MHACVVCNPQNKVYYRDPPTCIVYELLPSGTELKIVFKAQDGDRSEVQRFFFTQVRQGLGFKPITWAVSTVSCDQAHEGEDSQSFCS